MTSTTDYRSQGRKLTAKDLAERLVPDLHMNEFISWAPDLFALTSYILSNTGAYQLVVSPPTKMTWEPTNPELRELIGVEFKKGQWRSITNDNGLRQKIHNWLKNYLILEEAKQTESKKSKQSKKASNPEESKKWPLDPTDWSHCMIDSSTGYFNDEWLRALIRTSKGVTCDTKIATIVDHIEHYALLSLDSDFGEILKNDDEKGWIPFVQKLGDKWRDRLMVMSDHEFQLINHALKEEEGNLFTDVRTKYDEELFDGTALSYEDYLNTYLGGKEFPEREKTREKNLLGILLKNTPPLLLACWAHFYTEVNCENFYGKENRLLDVSELLCNRDEIQVDTDLKKKLWKIAQAILTLHAVADICCTKWGIHPVKDPRKMRARWYAEKLLYDKGSLSTINPERGRVIPKRHNPGVGITLRSISSNLAFHRSSVDVVWRRTANTPLERKLEKMKENQTKTLSILLMPFPLDVKAKHFKEETDVEHIVNMHEDYGFFNYNPQMKLPEPHIIKEDSELIERIENLIAEAKQELDEDRFVDIVVFPESALSKRQYEELQEKLAKEQRQFEILEAGQKLADNEITTLRKKIVSSGIVAEELDAKLVPTLRTQEELRENKRYMVESPSILIAGVRESRDDIAKNINKRNEREIERETNEEKKAKLAARKNVEEHDINFERNAVYCKYYSYDDKSYDGAPDRMTQKFKQYKHHRWHLDPSQIRSYGLSQILEPEKHRVWWEAMKVPRRRVSFLNVGNVMTISNLVCEDLARQDPIADLIRHVGPTLVVTLLMDGPQLKNRWSSRYASILSDDPGSSVITLTSFGMVKRYNSPYGLSSRVVALWSESGGRGGVREIELANGAEAILLTLKLEPKQERTADGREERVPTNMLSLVDVIQIYPPGDSIR